MSNTEDMATHSSASRSRLSTSPFRREPEPERPAWEADARVMHDRHGLGRIVRVRGDRMDVRFGSVTVDVDTRSPRIHLL